MKFQIYKNELKAALLFAADCSEPHKKAYAGVHFEIRNGESPLIVATSGPILCAIKSESLLPAHGDGKVTITRNVAEVIISAAEAVDPVNPRLGFSFSDNQLSVSAPRQVFEFQNATIAESFPNWRGVEPRVPPCKISELGLDPLLINTFVKAKEFLAPKDSALCFRFFGELAQVEIVFSGSSQFYGLIMPMRIGSPVFRPDFVKPPIKIEPVIIKHL